ncbi:MAG: four helix bundle protein [candidate division WOR-3 bacterium]|jgi:four helix bundle protein
MSKIDKFEDIKAWQKARKLVKEIYNTTKKGSFIKDFGLCKQIQNASVSIMANIAEGFDSQSDDEFVRFLRYGLRSATEVQSHLYVSLDQDYIKKESFDKLYKEIEEIKSLIAGFIRCLRSES